MKIAIIGVGNIGKFLTKSLLDMIESKKNEQTIDEIIWLGRNKNKMNAKKNNLRQDYLAEVKPDDYLRQSMADFVDKKLIVTKDYSYISDVDFIITTYGLPMHLFEKYPAVVLDKNSKITKNIVGKMHPHLNKKTTIINITTPVDVITGQLQKLSGLPTNQVIGISGMVDVSRFADAIYQIFSKKDKNFACQDIDMGSLRVLSEPAICAVLLLNQVIVHCLPLSPKITAEEAQAMFTYVKNKGIEMADAGNGICARHTTAAAVISIIDAIRNKKNAQMIVSIFNPKYGVTQGSIANINNGILNVISLDNIIASELLASILDASNREPSKLKFLNDQQLAVPKSACANREMFRFFSSCSVSKLQGNVAQSNRYAFQKTSSYTSLLRPSINNSRGISTRQHKTLPSILRMR